MNLNLNYNKHLKAFFAGTSSIILFHFFIVVRFIEKNNKINNNKYNFFMYAFIAPLWFGIHNLISSILEEQFKLTKKQRFLLIFLVSVFIAILSTTINKTYNFNLLEWISYIIFMFFAYLISWFVIIYVIERKILDE